MEWKEVKLGEVCTLVSGYAFKAKDFGDYPQKVVKIGDITPPFVNYETESGVDVSCYDKTKLSKFLVQYDDFVLAMTGATIGKVGRYVSSEPSYLNQRVLLFKNKEDYDIKYIYYLVSSAKFAKYVVNHIDSESAQPNISANTISKYQFEIPTRIADQRRIAAILSSLDRKIELNNQINKTLEEMAQAIFKNWFVDFGPFQDGEFVESELGLIPKGWRVGTLNEVIEIKYGKDHKKLNEGKYPVYGSGGFMRSVDQYIYERESVLIPRKGTLNNIMYVNEPFWTVDTMFYSKPKSESVMKYIHQHLKLFDFERMNEGTSIPSTTTATLNGLKIIIPSCDILKKFDDIIDTIYVKISTIKSENSTLAHLRDTLLPKLMSGEIEL